MVRARGIYAAQMKPNLLIIIGHYRKLMSDFNIAFKLMSDFNIGFEHSLEYRLFEENYFHIIYIFI